jgi:hypothetical protein
MACLAGWPPRWKRPSRRRARVCLRFSCGTQDRSTRQLVNVQLTDARDQVTKAYQGIAELRSEDPADVRRQAMLTASMTTIIGDLNAASAAVRGLPDQPDPQVLHRRLRDGADTLERDYR